MGRYRRMLGMMPASAGVRPQRLDVFCDESLVRLRLRRADQAMFDQMVPGRDDEIHPEMGDHGAEGHNPGETAKHSTVRERKCPVELSDSTPVVPEIARTNPKIAMRGGSGTSSKGSDLFNVIHRRLRGALTDSPLFSTFPAPALV
jgi:hypothetical protein